MQDIKIYFKFNKTSRVLKNKSLVFVEEVNRTDNCGKGII